MVTLPVEKLPKPKVDCFCIALAPHALISTKLAVTFPIRIKRLSVPPDARSFRAPWRPGRRWVSGKRRTRPSASSSRPAYPCPLAGRRASRPGWCWRARPPSPSSWSRWGTSWGRLAPAWTAKLYFNPKKCLNFTEMPRSKGIERNFGKRLNRNTKGSPKHIPSGNAICSIRFVQNYSFSWVLLRAAR